LSPGEILGLVGKGALGTSLGVGALDLAAKAPWASKVLGTVGGVGGYLAGKTPGVTGGAEGGVSVPGVPDTTPGVDSFPTNPKVGDKATIAGVNYIWDGTQWGIDTGTSATGNPNVVTVGGQNFWQDPATGAWSIITADTGMTPEQQLGLFLGETGGTSLALQQEQEEVARQLQAQQAAEQIAQIYAANPYLYWAQLGQGTPESVAALTRGQAQPGQPFSPTPLGVPSAQWWNNLGPNEQQQIFGALNWMGVNPAEYQNLYNKMIPGLGAQQQAVAQWTR
jgi:hypothetical protein